MQLRTGIWAGALIRRAELGGAFATVARKGDEDGGAVLVKVTTRPGQARLYAPAADGDGELCWMDLSAGPLGVDESAIDAYARKRAAGDPDLWIVEIEDKAGRHFLTEPVRED
jgi:hypothetical protein